MLRVNHVLRRVTLFGEATAAADVGQEAAEAHAHARARVGAGARGSVCGNINAKAHAREESSQRITCRGRKGGKN